ncbi:MAG: excinuclease ABC subunit UvrC [Thermodesulfovibrionia bacterium]
MNIIKKIGQIPPSPGIYIMKGAKERVIYVGKAKNLKNRIRSYFQDSAILDTRKLKMVKEVRDIDYLVTENELEALVLEANFIKRFKPRYNIILRDDKNYPYLKLTINEEWPRLEVVRRIERNGSLYFGPYVPAGSMWEVLRFIRRTFPIRQCRYNLERPFRPCVQFQMGRCLAPCSEDRRSELDRQRYMEVVEDVRRFLQGEKRELLDRLQQRMNALADDLRFEEAAEIRDRLRNIERAWESQRVISPKLGDTDVIGVYREGDEASIFILFIRNGMVMGQKGFYLKRLHGVEDSELISSFIEQFYCKEMLIPERVIIQIKIDLITHGLWLSNRKGVDVEIRMPEDEHEDGVLKMAIENAEHFFKTQRGEGFDNTLPSIKRLLNLKENPKRIGAIDVSNISGSEAVGALIIWEDKAFVKDEYRLFRIKTVEGIDDFAMIGEVAGRYLKNLSDEKKMLPNLLLIDGGKGQLDSVMKAIAPFKLPIEIAAIAKARDEHPLDRIYLPDKKEPIILEQHLPSTILLQRIRDEAHRFAIGYHKKLRKKRLLESPLEKVKGIGKRRRLLLLKHFGSIDAIRKAPVEEIASIKGMNKKAAEALKRALV